MSNTYVVISGIPAGDSGTGRFVAHLKSRIGELSSGSIRLITKPERPALWLVKMWMQQRAYKHLLQELVLFSILTWRFWIGVFGVMIRPNMQLMLLHPQNLGYQLSLRLLESRKEPPLIYLLDSSFFCISSYNHLPNESFACLRCLKSGFDQILQNNCKPFPRADKYAINFAPRLQKLVRSGHVKVAAQNLRQAELAQKHFGLSSLPSVVGLWTRDWDDVFDQNNESLVDSVISQYSWDILFHGHALDAKGASWIVKLAVLCPELRFMFPFARPKGFEASSNCFFIPCSWESGLQEEIKKSRYVAVPSLWSAPIEGALVKSIVCARGVIVAENLSSFCDELPNGLVLKISAIPKFAAQDLRKAIECNWLPDESIKSVWISDFRNLQSNFVKKLLTLFV